MHEVHARSGKTRLAQDIGVLLNSANTPPAQKEAMIKDVQSILETGGASTENASAVAADLTTVTDEIKAEIGACLRGGGGLWRRLASVH